jgi:effector-binding domain-containing protein
VIDTPHIIQTEEQHTVFIPLKIPRAEIRTVMGPGLADLRHEVAAQGIAITGPWFTHHLRMSPAFFDFELSVPVASPVTPAGRMKPGVRPAMKMAHTVYEGPYEGLGGAWKEFDRWIGAEGITTGPDLWECYARGPESGPDSSRYRTELSVQILD